MPTRWKLKRIRGGGRDSERKKSVSGLAFRSTKGENMCSNGEKPSTKPTPHSGKGRGPWLQSLPFMTFDLLQSRQEALT